MTKISWRYANFVAFLATLLLISGCVTDRTSNDDSICINASLEEIQNDPVRYAGRIYCGRAFIRTFDRVTVIVASRDDRPSLDTTMLIVEGLEMLSQISDIPREYDIRAKIEILPSCYSPSEERPPGPSGECAPFRRPIFFELRSARALGLR